MRVSRDQRRGDHLAPAAQGLDLTLERKAAHPGLVAEVHLTGGLALQNSDFGVGSFQRSGRNAVVIVVEDALAMGREGVGEANQHANTGARRSRDNLLAAHPA